MLIMFSLPLLLMFPPLIPSHLDPLPFCFSLENKQDNNIILVKISQEKTKTSTLDKTNNQKEKSSIGGREFETHLFSQSGIP